MNSAALFVYKEFFSPTASQAMSEFSQLPVEQRISGHASFLHRNTPWWQWINIYLADALVFIMGCILWLGGRPLRRLLVRGLSGAAYQIMRKKQRIANINLDLAYNNSLSDEQKTKIIRAMYTHFARGVLDLLFDWVYWPPKNIARYVTSEGRERLSTMKNAPGGCALVCCHLGNPDLALKLVRAVDFDVHVMYKGFKSPWFDRYIARKRLSVGSGLIEVPSSRHRIVNGKRESLGRPSIRKEVQDLFEQGHCLGFLADQYANRGGIEMEILGVPGTPTQTGAWSYVVDQKAPYLMVVGVYAKDESFQWHSSPIMQIEDQGDRDATIKHTMMQANEWFESLIRQYPEQYFWGHRRFNRSHYQ